jgi:hypothetical protein
MRMNPSDVQAASSQEGSSEQVKQAAREAVSQGADIRAKVRDLTMFALQRRRFDRHGFRDVVRAVTEGVVLGADGSRSDMRRSLADAFGGLDQAITTSAEAGQAALRQLTASGQNFSDHEFKQALANLRKIEDDFLATVGMVADGASDKVGPELNRILGNARSSGTQTGKQVAVTMGEFAQHFTAASLDVTIAGVQAAGEFGGRFAMLASGILSGLADALRPGAPDKMPEKMPEKAPDPAANADKPPEQKSEPSDSVSRP